MRMSGGKRLLCKIISGRSRGATLVEVVIAIVVLGLMVATIPPVMVLAFDSQSRQNELRIGQSLTRSQFEYIKSQEYIWGNTTDTDETGRHMRVMYAEVGRSLESYGIVVLAEPIYINLEDPEDPYIGKRLRYIWYEKFGEEYSGQDWGVQEIEVIVFGYRYAPPCDPDDPGCDLMKDDVREILRSTDYKVARGLEISGYEVNPTEEG